MKNAIIFILAIGFALMCLVCFKPSVKTCDSYMGEVIRYPNGLVCEINIREEDSAL